MAEETGQLKTSALRRISQGVVVSVDPEDERIIHVSPREKMPYMSGQADINPIVIEYKSKNSHGENIEDKAVTTTTMKAMWLPWGSGLITPPNLQPGEWVAIWQVGDEDQYWYTELGLHDHLRRLETKTWVISGTPETKENKAINELEWYFLEWSSHKKHLLMSNSKANGEVVQYTMKFDFGKGTFSIADDLDNSWTLDSIEANWTFRNTNGCMVKMEKDDIDIVAIRNYTLSAGENFTVNAKTATFNIQESYTVNCKTYSCKAGDSWSVNTKTASITAPNGITLNGPLTHTGGNATSTGSLTTTGEVTAKGIAVSTHKHGGVRGGSDTSAGPQ